MASRPDPERMALWRELGRTHGAISAALSAQLEAELGLPLSWFAVLDALGEAGGRLRMQDLATSAAVNKSSLTRLIDRMEDAGLVQRERSHDDGRGWFACLTATGRSQLRQAVPLHQRVVQREFARHLTDSDVTALARVLAKVEH